MKPELRRLSVEEYKGRKFTVRYQTNGYYDIKRTESGFEITYQPFETAVEKSFDDTFFADWLEQPVAIGAFEGERLIGYIEGSPETWNNRFRVSNIVIFDSLSRNRGIGTALMQKIEAEAITSDARMLVLETQSCNEAAIAFYRKNGFTLIGFDLYAYTDSDPERHEVRFEMGKKLMRPSKT